MSSSPRDIAQSALWRENYDPGSGGKEEWREDVKKLESDIQKIVDSAVRDLKEENARLRKLLDHIHQVAAQQSDVTILEDTPDEWTKRTWRTPRACYRSGSRTPEQMP